MNPVLSVGDTRTRVASAIAVAVLLAATEAAVAADVADVADMDLNQLVRVRISPFDVATRLDQGYRGANAVSGSRFDTPIRDLPFAIQAFTESFIEDQHPVTIFDIARYSPGVTYRSNDFNEGNANLALRGFTVSAQPGNPQILRDGFHGASIFDFTNISRVEVVKGPSSFLYGQVAPGGVVNVITKSPQSRFAFSGDISYGSYGEHRAQVDVTGPAGNGLFYRLASSYERDMHYWQPYDAHSWNVSPSLLWQPNERVSVSLKYEGFHKVESPQLMQKPAYGRQAGLVPTAADPSRQGAEVPGLPDNWNSMADVDYRRSDSRAFSAWVDVNATKNWSLRTGYARQHYAVDALFSGNLGMSNNTTFLQGRRLRTQDYVNDDSTWSLDAAGQYRLERASLRLLLGAQRVKRSFANTAGQAPNDPALGSDPIGSPLPLWDLRDPSTWNRTVDIPLSTLTESRADRIINETSNSFYAGATVGLLDERLLLLAGWRSTSSRSRITDHLSNTMLPLSASKATPQFGVLYKLNPQLSVFASYARSFVPGSQLLNQPDGSSVPAEPSEGKGYDLGVKASLLDGRIAGTLTLFDLRNRKIVNDLAQTNAAGSVVIYNVQSGEQRSRGLELDTTIAVTDNWQAYASYSYMDARIVEFSGNDAQILAQDPATLSAAARSNYKNVSLLHNARLQMSAPHLFNLWTRYDFTGGGLSGSYVAGGVNVVRDQTILPDSPPELRQSYALVNALIGRTWTVGQRRISLELMGKNLTNEQYRPSQSTRSRPRELLLTLRTDL